MQHFRNRKIGSCQCFPLKLKTWWAADLSLVRLAGFAVLAGAACSCCDGLLATASPCVSCVQLLPAANAVDTSAIGILRKSCKHALSAAGMAIQLAPSACDWLSLPWHVARRGMPTLSTSATAGLKRKSVATGAWSASDCRPSTPLAVSRRDHDTDTSARVCRKCSRGQAAKAWKRARRSS